MVWEMKYGRFTMLKFKNIIPKNIPFQGKVIYSRGNPVYITNCTKGDRIEIPSKVISNI